MNITEINTLTEQDKQDVITFFEAMQKDSELTWHTKVREGVNINYERINSLVNSFRIERLNYDMKKRQLVEEVLSNWDVKIGEKVEVLDRAGKPVVCFLANITYIDDRLKFTFDRLNKDGSRSKFPPQLPDSVKIDQIKPYRK